MAELKKLILSLNELSPDIAQLEMNDNLRLMRRVIARLIEFRTKELYEFEKLIKEIRRQRLASTRNKQPNINL